MKQRRFNKKFVFTAVGMLCLISAVAASAAYPKINAIIKSRSEFLDGTKELELCEEAVMSIEEYNLNDKPVIGMLLAKYQASLPAGEHVPELVAEVRRACRAFGVRNVSISTRKAELIVKGRDPIAVCADGAIHSLPIAINGIGTYRGIAMLLNTLANGRRLVIAKSLNVEGPEPGSTLVRFQAEAQAFCFLPIGED